MRIDVAACAYSLAYFSEEACKMRPRADLTIRNITREVVLEGEYSGVSQSPWNTYSAGFSLRGKVNRKDWGLNWNMVLAGGGLVAGDEITLVIDLELTKPVEAVASSQAAGTPA
jgi:YceI-like domain